MSAIVGYRGEMNGENAFWPRLKKGTIAGLKKGVGRICLDDEDHRPDLVLHGDP